MSDTLAFHAAAPDGVEGYVVLLHRPDEAGRLETTEWPSEGYLAPGRGGKTTVDEVLERVRGWRRGGWALSESVERIESWLRYPPR